MFTGIVQAMGEVVDLDRQGEDIRLRVHGGHLDLSDAVVGDSIAVNGVCLTVTGIASGVITADVSRETLSCTTLSELRRGDPVNLEQALLPTTRLGGHLVSGHVDGVGEISGIRDVGRSHCVTVTVPSELARYVAPKGSICVDGISLTVNGVAGAGFEVNVIPHTMERTIVQTYGCGTRVNIEVDIVARYIERLLSAAEDEAGHKGVSEALLARHGFMDD